VKDGAAAGHRGGQHGRHHFHGGRVIVGVGPWWWGTALPVLVLSSARVLWAPRSVIVEEPPVYIERSPVTHPEGYWYYLPKREGLLSASTELPKSPGSPFSRRRRTDASARQGRRSPWLSMPRGDVELAAEVLEGDPPPSAPPPCASEKCRRASANSSSVTFLAGDRHGFGEGERGAPRAPSSGGWSRTRPPRGSCPPRRRPADRGSC